MLLDRSSALLTCLAVRSPSWAETCLNVSQLAPLCWQAIRRARSASLEHTRISGKLLDHLFQLCPPTGSTPRPSLRWEPVSPSWPEQAFLPAHTPPSRGWCPCWRLPGTTTDAGTAGTSPVIPPGGPGGAGAEGRPEEAVQAPPLDASNVSPTSHPSEKVYLLQVLRRGGGASLQQRHHLVIERGAFSQAPPQSP